MMATIGQFKIVKLFLNEALWPRRTLSRINIKRIEQALRRGEAIPPIIIDRKSKTVVDGWHRVKAVEGVYGEDAEIVVEWHNYHSEAEMFAEATRLNSRHGEPLTPLDQAFCLDRAKELGIEQETILSALNLTPVAAGEITARRFATGPDGQIVVLKRSVSHLAGEELTAIQVQANERVSGFGPREHCEQLIAFLEGGLVPEDFPDAVLADRLRHLHVLLANILAVPVG